MTKNLRIGLFAGAFVLATLPALRLSARHGHDHDRDRDHHVLLISIDGMHAVDYENCVASNTCPTLAALGKTGVNYTRTTTSRPSDSFPGLMALVTGGTPKTVGAFYDVAYDRVLAPPMNTTGNGLAGGTCAQGKVVVREASVLGLFFRTAGVDHADIGLDDDVGSAGVAVRR